jgi:hypothetical protein
LACRDKRKKSDTTGKDSRHDAVISFWHAPAYLEIRRRRCGFS